MKGFVRMDTMFSQCGLNCGLCIMQIDGYCPGCGGGDGNQGCAIARCGIQRGGMEYCFQCPEYPCPRYEGSGQKDSFISYRNQRADMEKCRSIGRDAYRAALEKKKDVLHKLLSEYNDGRRKRFFCLAVNLLEIEDLDHVLEVLAESHTMESEVKIRAQSAVALLNEMAAARGIVLKLKR